MFEDVFEVAKTLDEGHKIEILFLAKGDQLFYLFLCIVVFSFYRGQTASIGEGIFEFEEEASDYILVAIGYEIYEVY